MTVCVAAISHPMVFGASDRMITTGDIQFEPEQAKIWQLTTSIAAMVAGDIAIQSEVAHLVRARIASQIEAKPPALKVSDVANMWADAYIKIRSRQAERLILAPLGLNHDTFIARNQELAPGLANKVAQELLEFRIAGVDTIIAGLDTDGPHIYVVSDDDVQCRDKIGFAAIGIGFWHAESLFMFNGHTPNRELPETLLRVYSAKKRAQVAPGVGSDTDMFMIGPKIGTYIPFATDPVDRLEQIYQSAEKGHNEVNQEANKAVNNFIVETVLKVAIQD